MKYEKVDQKENEDSMVIVNAERVGDDAPASFSADANKSPYDDGETIVSEDIGKQVAHGAAFCWGLFGCILGGFPLALLGAWGGAHTATHNDGPVGDLSRSLGEVAIAASNKAKEKQIKEKTGKVAKATARQLKESFKGRKNASAANTSSQKPNAQVL
jgi:hypothetical protein